jgi:predicted peptidase
VRSPILPRSIVLAAAAVLPLLCSLGGERRPAAAQGVGFERVVGGRTTVAAPPRDETAEPRDDDIVPGPPSDTTGVLLPRTFDPSGDRALAHRYFLYLPRGIEDGRRWPLILYLHGRSLRGDDLALLTRYGLPDRLEDDEEFPFVVVAPQLPAGQSWTDTDRLAALVRDVSARYPVDPDRVYLIGYSMGGGGVWRVAIDHPDLFAAAAPAAAWTPEPTNAIARALEHLPIRVYHGTEDEAAPFARAEAMVKALEAAGVDVTFTVVPGADHGDLTDIYDEDDLYDWLLAHRAGRRAR